MSTLVPLNFPRHFHTDLGGKDGARKPSLGCNIAQASNYAQAFLRRKVQLEGRGGRLVSSPILVRTSMTLMDGQNIPDRVEKPCRAPREGEKRQNTRLIGEVGRLLARKCTVHEKQNSLSREPDPAGPEYDREKVMFGRAKPPSLQSKPFVNFSPWMTGPLPVCLSTGALQAL
ncbi:MAG: hypothetical protein TREMPRED_000765 [Tremellales sp. Tagirdzhanova-0007]|nr:MAG: hypothetical protein TREMPRED_000765 [Tremellales sp. Tagirdzhanova-0007]